MLNSLQRLQRRWLKTKKNQIEVVNIEDETPKVTLVPIKPKKIASIKQEQGDKAPKLIKDIFIDTYNTSISEG